MSRVHIIGAGFSGLTLAYHLIQRGQKVELFEKSKSVGGLLSSEVTESGIVESAANGLLNSSHVQTLFNDLGIVQAARPAGRPKRYIYRDGLKTWPLHVSETFKLLSGVFKVALNDRPNIRENESLKDWVSRTFGEAAFDHLISAALQGVYGTSDLDAELIYRAVQKARQDGRARRKNKLMAGTVAPQNGMGELIEKLKIYIVNNGGEIHTEANGDVRLSHPTVLATSAPAAALLLVEEAPELSRLLAKIEYLPLYSLTCFFASSAERAKGFGCLFPQKANFLSLGVLFNNGIFQNRAREHSETWILSGKDLTKESVVQSVLRDRKKLFGVEDELQDSRFFAWPHAIPHYNSTLRQVIDNLSLPPQLYLTGNYLGGIGLGKILEMNERLASQICDEVM